MAKTKGHRTVSNIANLFYICKDFCATIVQPLELSDHSA